MRELLRRLAALVRHWRSIRRPVHGNRTVVMATEHVTDCNGGDDPAVLPAIDIDDVTRAEIAEALTHLAATASRMPKHWVDRKAALHRQIDDLLTQWEQACE